MCWDIIRHSKIKQAEKYLLINVKTLELKLLLSEKKKYPFAGQVQHSIGHISGDLDLIFGRYGISLISSEIFFQVAIFCQAHDNQYWL